VQERVRAGGHSIPEEVIRRRFVRGLRNFFKIYQPILDGWVLFDGSGAEPLLISMSVSDWQHAFEPALFAKIKEEGR